MAIAYEDYLNGVNMIEMQRGITEDSTHTLQYGLDYFRTQVNDLQANTTLDVRCKVLDRRTSQLATDEGAGHGNIYNIYSDAYVAKYGMPNWWDLALDVNAVNNIPTTVNDTLTAQDVITGTNLQTKINELGITAGGGSSTLRDVTFDIDLQLLRIPIIISDLNKVIKVDVNGAIIGYTVKQTHIDAGYIDVDPSINGYSGNTFSIKIYIVSASKISVDVIADLIVPIFNEFKNFDTSKFKLSQDNTALQFTTSGSISSKLVLMFYPSYESASDDSSFVRATSFNLSNGSTVDTYLADIYNMSAGSTFNYYAKLASFGEYGELYSKLVTGSLTVPSTSSSSSSSSSSASGSSSASSSSSSYSSSSASSSSYSSYSSASASSSSSAS